MKAENMRFMIMKQILVLVFTLGVALSQSTFAANARMTLEDFLSAVRVQNATYKSAATSVSGAELRMSDAKLVYSPSLFGSYTNAKDKLLTSVLFPPYKDYQMTQYQLGLQGQTPVGLSAKIYYTLSETEYVGLKPAYSVARPTIELSQSLYRNFFGQETRATHDAIESSTKVSGLNSEFNADSVISQAEGAYWRVVFAKHIFEVQKESVERAQAVYEWSEKRNRVQLAEKSDLIQAEANLKVRKLLLAQAADEVRAAGLSFNAFLGVPSDIIPQDLENESDAINSIHLPTKMGVRADVKAVQEQVKSAAANAQLQSEKSKPDFTLFGTYAWGAQKPSQSEATSNSFTSDNREIAYGVKFTAPIDIFSGIHSRKGWDQERDAAELANDAKLFEQQRDWNDLVSRLTEAKNRLGLSRSIEAIQAEKAKLEKDRLKQGRSTTFLVSTYDQDYASARVTTLQIESEIMSIAAKLKLYKEAL